jgi:hypothetical protein
MKKSILLGLLSLTVSVLPSLGQGTIKLDNYNTSGPYITYGSAGLPANGVSGSAGTVGTGLLAGWTMGFYYALGDITGSTLPDPSGGEGIPGTFGGVYTLATGSGSTAAFYTSTFNTPGAAKANSVFVVPGTSSNGGDTITMMVVAYNGSSSYASSDLRDHSGAFIMTTAGSTSVTPSLTGQSMPGFAIVTPEPSIFALVGMGGLMLIRFRRRK